MRAIHLKAFEEPVVAAVCRMLDLIARLLPATECESISACSVLAERVGSPILRVAAAQRDTLLHVATATAIWGPRRVGEVKSLGDAALHFPTDDHAKIATAVVDALRHSVDTRERWAAEADVKDITRWDRLRTIREEQRHVNAVQQIVERMIGRGARGRSVEWWPVRTEASSRHEIAGIDTLAVGGVIPMGDLSAVLQSVTQRGMGLGYRTIVSRIRRVQIAPTRLPAVGKVCVDRAEGVHSALDAMDPPRDAAVVSAARTLMGTVVRDVGWLRDGLASFPDDAGEGPVSWLWPCWEKRYRSNRRSRIHATHSTWPPPAWRRRSRMSRQPAPMQHGSIAECPSPNRRGVARCCPMTSPDSRGAKWKQTCAPSKVECSAYQTRMPRSTSLAMPSNACVSAAGGW